VVPPAEIQAEQIKLDLRIAAAQEQAGGEQRPVDALRRIMQRNAPGAGIDAHRWRQVGARHANITFELRMMGHQIGQVALVHHGTFVGKNSCENISMERQVSSSSRPAQNTTPLYHRSPSPSRNVSAEFHMVTGSGTGAGRSRLPRMHSNMDTARQTG